MKSGLKRRKGRKLASLKSLRNKLDKVFSLYIRNRDADEEGIGNCATCEIADKLQCGHFIKRQHQAVRWDERNAAGQCLRCNHFLGGAQDEFSDYIINRWGYPVFNELMELKHTTVKYTRSDLEEMIAKYSKVA